MNKTQRIIIQLFCLLVAVTILYGCSSPIHVEESSVEQVSIDELNFPESSGGVIASYNDFSDSLQSLEEKSELIVRGKVKGYSPTKVGVITQVAISDTFKGEIAGVINVYQLGSVNDDGTIIGDVLQSEGDYILFLGLQNDSSKNSVYVTGGTQGAFQVAANGKIINKDPTMLKELGQIVKSDSSDFDVLVDFIQK